MYVLLYHDNSFAYEAVATQLKTEWSPAEWTVPRAHYQQISIHLRSIQTALELSTTVSMSMYSVYIMYSYLKYALSAWSNILTVQIYM